MIHKIFSKNRKVLIRCDASHDVGFGHVMRCLSLADELQNNYGCIAIFLMRQAEIGFESVRAKGYTVITPETKHHFDYQKWVKDGVKDTKADTLILDVRDDLPRGILKSLKSDKIFIVTLDDPSDRRLDADLAFYPPVPQVRHMNWTDFDGELYSGWEWVIVRKEFTVNIKRTKNKRPVILVTMGGSDPQGLTLKAVKALDTIREDFDVVVILGKGFQLQEELSTLLSTTKRNFDLRQNVQNMAKLMASADFAVASFGVTAYELAAVGVPAIYLCLTEDHSQSASAFVNAGIAVNMGVHDLISETRLADTITKYISNTSLRLNMIKCNKQLPKIYGANRIAALILKRG